MPLKRLVLVSFILSSLLQANEEIQKSFFKESKSLAQCTFYYPILSEQEKMDIQSERISISEESIFLEEDVVLKFDGGLFTSSSADLKENSNLINFNNNADIFLNDLYLQAQRGKFDRSNNTFELYSGNSYWKKPNIFINFDSAEGANDSVTFTNASLSSCVDTSSGWALKAVQIEINDEIGKGSAKKIRLEIFNKTVFRLPYLPIYLSEDLENNPEEVQKRVEKIIKPELDDMFDDNTIFQVNPTGNFVTGGPDGDTGITGRKIIVDTYGGYAPHGGGAFSGKDCTKVDRSGAYMAR